MNLTPSETETLKMFREKFGRFYVSIDSKTKAIRIVDIENGQKVNGDDGSLIECVASGDIESFWLTQLRLAEWKLEKARAEERRKAYEDGKKNMIERLKSRGFIVGVREGDAFKEEDWESAREV